MDIFFDRLHATKRLVSRVIPLLLIFQLTPMAGSLLMDNAFAVDTTKPVSSVSYTPLYAKAADSATGITVDFSASDDAGLASIQIYADSSSALTSARLCGSFTFAGELTSSGTVNCAIGNIADGTIYLYSRTTDSAGNVEDKPLTADDTFIKDVVAPVSNLNTTSFNRQSNLYVNPTYTASDARTGLSSVTFYYSETTTLASPVTCFTIALAASDTGTKTNASSNQTCTLPTVDKSYYLFTRATDVAGNIEAAPASADAIYTVDNLAPAIRTLTGNGTTVVVVSPTQITIREESNSYNIDFTTSDSNTASGNAVSASIGGPDASLFALYTGNKTPLSLKNPMNYEAPIDSDLNGIYQVTLTLTDSAGNSSSRDLSVTIGNAPEVVDVTSTAADGLYAQGATIPIQVKFDMPVTTINTANFALQMRNKTGGLNNAWYASGSGTDTLTFNYLVILDDTSTDLSYALTSSLFYTAGSYTLTGNGYASTMVLPALGGAGSLSANKNIVIDAIATTLTSTSATNVTGYSATINFTASETGTYYILVMDSATAAPSVSAVVFQGTSVAKASGAMAIGANSVNVTGLAGSSPYYAYIAAADPLGNKQASPYRVAFTTITPDVTKPISSGSITETYTAGTSFTVAYTASDTGTLASINVYYSTNSSLTSPVSCGTASLSGTSASGNITCTIPATDASYYIYTRATDAAGNVENAPTAGNAQDSIIRDTAAALITGPSGSAGASTSSKSIPENSTAVATITANETATWTISGTDASFFAIDSSTGVLTISARDFENPADSDTNNSYIVTVTATDRVGNTSSQTITVTITDVDEIAPVLSSTSATSITSSGAVLNYSTNEAGSAYYLIYLATDAAPSGATIVAQGTAVAKGSASVTTGAKTFTASGLTGLTDYTAYVVVRDVAGNISLVSSIAFTTLTNAPTILSFSSTRTGTTSVAFGDTVTVTGTKFAGATVVAIGGVAVDTFTVVDSATITFVSKRACCTAAKISVTNPFGTDTSTADLIPLPQLPVISSQPASISKTVGEVATFSVTVAAPLDGGTLSYQWRKGTTNLIGETGTSYSVTTSSLNYAGTYSVIVTNTVSATTSSVTSSGAVLTMAKRVLAQPNAPTITATAGVLKSLAVTWSAVPNAVAYTIKIYENDGTTLLATITGLSGTSKTITAADFASIADDHTYKITITATGDSNNTDSIASTLSSAITTNKSYSITYDSNTATGGNAPSAGSWITGASATVIAGNTGTLVRTGYTFLGWNTAANGTGTDYAANGSASYSTTANLLLYAKWSANTLNITYKSDFSGGGSDVTETATAGTSFSLKGNTFTRTGYAFAGWALTSGGSVSKADSATVTLLVDTTYFAQWTAVNYNITYYGNNNTAGSVPVDNSNYNIGNTITVKANSGALTRTGYSFIGWTLNQADTGTIYLLGSARDTITVGSSSISAYARWSKDTYYITYDSQQGTSVLNSSYQIGDTVTLASGPTRVGYTFAGWATTIGGSSVGSTYAPPGTGTVTLYAKWTAINYTITYDSNTATSGSVPTDSNNYNIGGTVTALGNTSNLARSGYTFGGWNTAANGSGTTYAAGNTFVMGSSDVTLYAQWTAINYTITYDSNSATSGSVPIDVNNYHIGDVVSISSSNGITRTGYTFAGWTVASNNTGTVMNSGYALTFGAGNITVYAKWTANTYTVTFSANGASGSPSATSASYTTGGTVITLPTVGTMAKAGYTFDGWSTTSNGTPLTGSYTTSTDVALVAVWTAINYTITYVPNGGSSTPTQASLIIGQTFTLASGITKPNGSQGEVYAFVGWNDGSSTYQPGYTYRIGTSNVTLTAVWVQVFEVTYAFNGSTDTPPANQLKFDGASITLASAPTYPGYQFAGWTDQSNQMFTAGANYTVGSTHYLIRAVWNAINYTVTYQAAGGSTTPISGSYTIGQTFILANAIARTGYTFTGWNNGSQTLAPGTSVRVGTSDMTFTAQWTANVYTVTYDFNGGTGTAIANASYTYGTSAITLPLVGDRVRTNYSFAGWSTVRGGTTVGLTYTPPSTMTLYAVWSLNQYAVTFNGNAVNVSNTTETYTAGGLALTLPLLTRTGFVFKGWYTGSSSGTLVGQGGDTYIPSATGSIYARWVQLSLSGVNASDLHALGAVTIQNGVGSTNTYTTTDSTVSVAIPAGALPTGTVVKFDFLDSAATHSATLPTQSSYIMSLVVSWVATDGTVPATAIGKPIVMTVTSATIKKGATVYAIAGDVVRLLGTATQDGSVSVEITEDPEVAIVKTKPGVPTNVSATDGANASSIVTWSAPTTNGGDAIASYTVTSSAGDICVTSTLTCAFNSLTNGTSYTFTVKAANSVGFSDASAASTAITPGAPAPVATAPVVTKPALQIVLQEVTNIQSTSAHVSVVIAWPGKIFTLQICATVGTAEGCDLSKKIVIEKLTQIEPLPSGNYLISTDITDLQSSSQYSVKAIMSTDDQQSTSQTRRIKTTSGISLVVQDGVTISINNNLVITVVAQRVTGSVKSWTATGLPGGVSLEKGQTTLKISGVVKSAGTFFVDVTAVDQDNGTATTRFIINVTGTDPAITIVSAAMQPIALARSTVSWIASGPGLVEVIYNGKSLCKSSANSCVVADLLGPLSKVQVVTRSASGAISYSKAAQYLSPIKPIEVGSARFAVNSAALVPAQKLVIEKLTATLQAKGFTQIIVSGYTDATGSKALNEKLSTQRAQNTFDHLKKYLSLRPLNVTLSGKASTNPIASNATEAGRAANRRAVVSIG